MAPLDEGFCVSAAKTPNAAKTPSAAKTPKSADARDGTVDVSVVIVSWNTRDLTRACLASVFKETAGIGFEVILVDNASADDTVAMVRAEFPQVRLIANPDNRGFVAANNQAFGIARGRYVLLLNSDTLVLDGAIQKTARYADSRPRGAVFGCRVHYGDMSLQRTCFMWPSLANIALQASFLYKIFPRSRFFGREYMTWWDYDEPRQVQTVCGCFSMVRKAAIDEVGPMDPVYFFYGDDPDWCYRFTKAGWEIHFFPGARIIHYGGQSSVQMKRAFRLQLSGSQLIFFRLHRSRAAFAAARLLIALFFLVRLPFWLAKAAVDRERRAAHLETVGTHLVGARYCLFSWKKLVMNPDALERRLADAR